MKVCILDLETTPDYGVWTRPEAPTIDDSKCEKCGEALPVNTPLAQLPKCKAMKRGTCRPPKAPLEAKEVFPPLYAHRIVCAGLASMDDDGWVLGAATAPMPEDEPSLLAWLAEVLPAYDRVVTWAGDRFDFPVLEMRALHHGVSLGVITPMAFDLHARFAPRWRGDNLSLDTIARLIGLPGKNGVDGSMVEAMANSGNFEAIASYCLHDVVQTAYLYLRSELIRGMKADEYRAQCKLLRASWEPREDFASFKVSPRLELI